STSRDRGTGHFIPARASKALEDFAILEPPQGALVVRRGQCREASFRFDYQVKRAPHGGAPTRKEATMKYLLMMQGHRAFRVKGRRRSALSRRGRGVRPGARRVAGSGPARGR